MITKLKHLIILLAVSVNTAAFADIAIIGHPDDDIGKIDSQNVKNLFLGERRAFPNGIHAVPVNHTVGSPDREKFFSMVLSMGETSHKRHWKRKISTGTYHSPEEVGSHRDLLESISTTRGSIGYIDASKVDDSVKVLLTIKSMDDV